jgi:hypothetical protein
VLHHHFSFNGLSAADMPTSYPVKLNGAAFGFIANYRIRQLLLRSAMVDWMAI